MKTSRVNNVLVILAFFGVIVAFQLVAFRSVPYFVVKAVAALVFSAACLVLAGNRESWDLFLTVVAALATMFAIAMTTGDRTTPHWWAFFLGFTAVAGVSVLLTRNRRVTLLTIAAIIGFRLIVGVFKVAAT
jgi:hypothetical protein